MTDHDPLDDFDDPGLAAALGALAPDADGDPYPAAHARFVRRRRRHRVVTAGSALVGAAAVVLAVAMIGGGGSGVSGVRTVPAHRGSSTSVPSTPSTTTLSTPPSDPAGVGVGATTTTTVSPATIATPHDQTFDSAGGSVRVRIAGTTVTLVANTPAAGYTADVRASGPDDVEVRFRAGSSGGTEHRIRLRFDDRGTLASAIT